mmetsp:Transcript_86730/g.273628  ORF Transcript_86730/g.273628 Transcript_86730/m.273628 type:complete len:200 (-) Transcript_86730:483-1082(-)
MTLSDGESLVLHRRCSFAIFRMYSARGTSSARTLMQMIHPWAWPVTSKFLEQGQDCNAALTVDTAWRASWKNWVGAPSSTAGCTKDWKGSGACWEGLGFQVPPGRVTRISGRSCLAPGTQASALGLRRLRRGAGFSSSTACLGGGGRVEKTGGLLDPAVEDGMLWVEASSSETEAVSGCSKLPGGLWVERSSSETSVAA